MTEDRMTPGDRPVTAWDELPAEDHDEVSPDVERLTQEIDATRDGMSETLDELGQRLDPAIIVANAKETVREATVGKVESMATTAGDIVTDAGTTASRPGGSGRARPRLALDEPGPRQPPRVLAAVDRAPLLRRAALAGR
jgi:hypothetical protein